MANIAIFRINYKSDFILTLNSDAGWMTPFCIKFWTGAPSQAYFVGFDGTTYTHCAPVDGEPTKLRVQFDDHHLPIGDLKFQIGYHFTVDDFPTSVEDEVLNQASVIIEVDDAPAQVMLDLNGETAPEIEFSLPAYANEAQRIANEQARIAAEQQRIANEDARIQAEETRQYNEQQRIQHEEARVTEFDRLKRESEAATGAANDAATLANEKAQLAAEKAALAQAAATLANEKAQLAADKAALAQDAADLANAKAALAQQKAEYAKAQGDYAKEQGIIAEEDHVRAEADHERAESDHATLENVPDSVPSTSPTDLSGNVEDVYLKNRSNNNPQAPRTLARLVTDSAKNRPLNESLTRLAEYQSLGFPAFSTSVSYAEGDPCFHDRRLYKAKAGGHSAGTWNAAHFEEFSVKEYTDAHVGIFDVSANNGGAVFASLQALLSDANLNTLIPAPFRRGGITINFIQGENAQSSDNKYVQYRYMGSSTAKADFTKVANWQGIDDEPIAGSGNLVKSGGVLGSLLEVSLDTFKTTSINIPVTSGKALDCIVNIDAKTDDVLTFNLPSTVLLASGGLNVYLGFTDNTEQSKTVGIGETEDVTLTKDLKYLRFARMSQGVIGTGFVIFNLGKDNNLEKDIESVKGDVADINSQITSLNNGLLQTNQNVTNLTTGLENTNLNVSKNGFDLYGNLNIPLKTTAGSTLNVVYDSIDIVKAGTTLTLSLLNTELIESNGVTVFFKFDDDSTISKVLKVGNTITYTLPKDLVSFTFIRSNTGVVGTGTAIVSVLSDWYLKKESNDNKNSIANINKHLHTTDFNAFGSEVIAIPAISGSYINFIYNKVDIKRGTNLKMYLPTTALLATGGINVIFNYTDSTESSPVNVPFNTYKTYTVEKDILSITFKRLNTGVIGTGNVNFNLYNLDSLKELVDAHYNDVVMYVATNGDDSNDGLSDSSAKATINAALSAGASSIMINEGEYFMGINLDNAKHDKVRIIGLCNQSAIILKHVNSLLYNEGDEETVTGASNVCKIALATPLTDTNARLFFDGMPDLSTEISSSEIMPNQRGKSYRCDCTQVVHTTSNTLSDAITEINTSSEYKWFYDADNSELYFKKPVSPTNVYPLMLPQKHAGFLYSTQKKQQLSLLNIEFRYASVNVNNMVNCEINGCAAKYVYSSGCFRYDSALNISFTNCEAAKAYNGSYGDGFNSSSFNSEAFTIGSMAKLINCWSHDNNDDGYSDHDGAYTLIIGGLYEYNGKAGITPARGSHCVCHDVLSRKNYSGFYYCLSASGNRGSMMLYNCISDSNNRGDESCGFMVDSGRKAILYNCIAMNEDIGYKCSNAYMQLMDCKSVNCTTVKSGTGITIVNGTLVE